MSALQVARATGAVMVVAAEAGLAVEEYGPNEVKSAVTGAGNADKAQVRDALVRVHGLRDVPSSRTRPTRSRSRSRISLARAAARRRRARRGAR